MSDWGYIILACVVAWGGVTVYALSLARRLTQARRIEQRLREMTEADAAEPAAVSRPTAGTPRAPGWAAEGDRSTCDVVPPAP